MEEAEDLVARAQCNVKRAEVADTGAEKKVRKGKRDVKKVIYEGSSRRKEH